MHANLKILRKVRKFLRCRTTARPHVLESLHQEFGTDFLGLVLFLNFKRIFYLECNYGWNIFSMVQFCSLNGVGMAAFQRLYRETNNEIFNKSVMPLPLA